MKRKKIGFYSIGEMILILGAAFYYINKLIKFNLLGELVFTLVYILISASIIMSIIILIDNFSKINGYMLIEALSLMVITVSITIGIFGKVKRVRCIAGYVLLATLIVSSYIFYRWCKEETKT